MPDLSRRRIRGRRLLHRQGRARRKRDVTRTAPIANVDGAPAGSVGITGHGDGRPGPHGRHLGIGRRSMAWARWRYRWRRDITGASFRRCRVPIKPTPGRCRCRHQDQVVVYRWCGRRRSGVRHTPLIVIDDAPTGNHRHSDGRPGVGFSTMANADGLTPVAAGCGHRLRRWLGDQATTWAMPMSAPGSGLSSPTSSGAAGTAEGATSCLYRAPIASVSERTCGDNCARQLPAPTACSSLRVGQHTPSGRHRHARRRKHDRDAGCWERDALAKRPPAI